MARSSVFYNCFVRLFGGGGFDGPDAPDPGCQDCGGGCTGEGCGCTDCDPGDDPCDDLVVLATCFDLADEISSFICPERVYTKQQLVALNCIADCQDPVLPTCESCPAGFLPDDCATCCPLPPPPGGGDPGSDDFKECEGFFCMDVPCNTSYADGGCVGAFKTQQPIDDPCPTQWNGQPVYNTRAAALAGPPRCYAADGPTTPTQPGGGGGGGNGPPTRPPAIGASQPCTLYQCVIVGQSDPGALYPFIDKECLGTTQTAGLWAAQFNLTTAVIDCAVIKSAAAAHGYFPDLTTCQTNCQDEILEPGTGGGGGASVQVWVCNDANSGSCELITTAAVNVGPDGKLITTGKQTYASNEQCVAGSQCCQQSTFSFWRCDEANDCNCVQDVEVQSCDQPDPPAGSYLTQEECLNSESACCKDDVADAAQTLASVYPFDVNGQPVGGMVANICPGDNLIIQPTDFDVVAGVSNEFDLTFETSNPIEIEFNETNGEISVNSTAIGSTFPVFFKLGVERECCGGGNPITIDVLVDSLVNVLDANDPQCDTGGGGGGGGDDPDAGTGTGTGGGAGGGTGGGTGGGGGGSTGGPGTGTGADPPGGSGTGGEIG